jgi:methyl-accepting chemotaxis protein
VKLKFKVYASLIAAVVVPLIIVTFMVSYNLKNQADVKLATADLPTAMKEVRNSIELQLLGPVVVSQSIAQNTMINDWIANGEDKNQLQSMTKYLTAIQQNNDAIAAFIVSEKSSNYYNTNGILKQVNRQNDAWFYRFLAVQNEYELSLDIDDATGIPTVFINYGVYINGQKNSNSWNRAIIR